MKRTAYLMCLIGSVLYLMLTLSILVTFSVFPRYIDPRGLILFVYYVIVALSAVYMAARIKQIENVMHSILILILSSLLAIPPVIIIAEAQRLSFIFEGETMVLGIYGAATILLVIAGGILALISWKRPCPNSKDSILKSGMIHMILGYTCGGANVIMGIFVTLAAFKSFERFTYPIESFKYIDDPAKPIFAFLVLLLLLVTCMGAVLRHRDRLTGSVLQLAAGAAILTIALIPAGYKFINLLIYRVVIIQTELLPAGFLTLPMTVIITLSQLILIITSILSIRKDMRSARQSANVI